MKYWPLLLLVVFCSCFLMKDFTKRPFTTDGENIELLVPKGYKSEKTIVDSATGNKEQYYYYSDGSLLYFVHAVDTTKEYQNINYGMNEPLVHSRGGFIYKGEDSVRNYWREIHIKHLRLGYKNVTQSQEVAFDSVLNYASMILPIK